MVIIKRIEIEICGGTIENAWNDLQKFATTTNAEVYGFFNTKKITSNMSLDEAYMEVIGKTKKEYDKEQQEYINKIKKEEGEHKNNTPKLVTEWIEKAKGVVRDDKIGFWSEIVPIRLGDLYRGMELDCTIKLVKMLDIDNCTLDEAKTEFDNQNHSGRSAGLMFSMMREFCVRGEDFVAYMRH